MVTREMLCNYLDQNDFDFLDFYERSKTKPKFIENNERTCEGLIKLGFALDPDFILQLFGSCFNSCQQNSFVCFIENLYLHLFCGKKNDREVAKVDFESLFKRISEKEKLTFENFNEQILNEIQDIKLENEYLKGLLEEFNIFISDIKEESLNLNKESYRRLKTLKASLSNLSTLASITKRTTESKFPSIDLALSLEISNEEYGKNNNNLKIFPYEKIKNNMKEDRINAINQCKSIEKLQLNQSNDQIISNQFIVLSDLIIKFFKNFEAEFSKKLNNQLEQLTKIQDQFRKAKYHKFLNINKGEKDFKFYRKYLNKIISEKELLLESYEHLKTDKNKLETHFVKNVMNLEAQIKSKTTEISTLHEKIQSYESKIDSSRTADCNDPLIIINLDQKLSEEKALQQDHSLSLNQSFQKQDPKFRIPNTSSKNFSFSDFLDPPKPDSKDQQISELQDALRSISERYEKEKGALLKDLEESRQDMENQIFRLKQEKAFQEIVCKELRSHLLELQKEKEAIEKEVIWMKAERNIYQKDELSVEFEISKSIERSRSYLKKTIQETVTEELNEISVGIRKKHLVDLNTAEIFDIIKGALVHMIKIKDAIELEVSVNEKYRESSRNLADVLCKLKMILRNIEEESRILNRKIDIVENDLIYREIQDMHSQYQTLVQYYKKQAQIKNSKILEKKHCIKLLKEQVSFLKKNLNDLQFNLGKIKEVDFLGFKEMFLLFVKGIPILSQDLECKLDFIFTKLSLSKQEINLLVQQRTNLNFPN